MAKFDDEIKINAPMDAVWQVLNDASTWSSWLPDAEVVTGLSSVAVGGAFQFQKGDKSGSGVIDRVDAEQGVLRLTTREGNKQETHTFDLDRRGFLGGNDTTLKYTMEYDAGNFIQEFVADDNPFESAEVRNTLKRFKSLVERRA
ncbi:MAG: SRPBCC family protein [Roseiflexaceae bacterium]|nr:SRPBCC family protein [Roseiflexaceae bacterium]